MVIGRLLTAITRQSKEGFVSVHKSRFVSSILDVLQAGGYIASYQCAGSYQLRVWVKPTTRCKPLKPLGLGYSFKHLAKLIGRLDKLYGGTMIISTSTGLLAGNDLMNSRVGGKPICYVYEEI